MATDVRDEIRDAAPDRSLSAIVHVHVVIHFRFYRVTSGSGMRRAFGAVLLDDVSRQVAVPDGLERAVRTAMWFLSAVKSGVTIQFA